MFSPFKPRTVNAYQRVSVESNMHITDKHQIVSLLFDGLVESLVNARGALARQDVSAKCAAASKALRILQEGLMAGVDKEEGGDLAQNLAALYEYSANRLILANARNDDALFLEVQRLIEPLAQSWKAMNQPPSAAGTPAGAAQQPAGHPAQMDNFKAFATLALRGRAGLYATPTFAGA